MEEMKDTKVESEAGFCLGMWSFLLSWVTADHEIRRKRAWIAQKWQSSLAFDIVSRHDLAHIIVIL